MPCHLQPILQRLDLDQDHWIDSVQQNRNRFHVMVGKLAFMQQLAKQLNRSWYKGKGGVMALYRGAESSG